jgi:hypothetical protein
MKAMCLAVQKTARFSARRIFERGRAQIHRRTVVRLVLPSFLALRIDALCLASAPVGYEPPILMPHHDLDVPKVTSGKIAWDRAGRHPHDGSAETAKFLHACVAAGIDSRSARDGFTSAFRSAPGRGLASSAASL